MLTEVIKEEITLLRSLRLALILLSLRDTSPHSAFTGTDRGMDERPAVKRIIDEMAKNDAEERRK